MADDDAHEAAADPGKTGRRQDGTWQKGVSGNPAGNSRGSRHRATLAIESLLDGQAERITQKAVELAMAGDLTAIRICLDRTVPLRRDRTVAFELPKLERPEDAIAAASAITQAVGDGELTPSEASELAKTIDVFVRAIEAHDLAERIATLEMLSKK